MENITFECFRKDCIKQYGCIPTINTMNIFSIIEDLYNTVDFDINYENEIIEII